jgi:hypothetical protein
MAANRSGASGGHDEHSEALATCVTMVAVTAAVCGMSQKGRFACSMSQASEHGMKRRGHLLAMHQFGFLPGLATGQSDRRQR